MNILAGKVAVVTGASRGIGRAVAQRMGKLGANVVINYIASEAPALETQAAVESAGGTALIVKADVSSVAEIDNLFARTLEHFGKIDIVIANAGIELVGIPVVDVTEADYDRLFAVNTKGAYFTLQRAARHVVDHGRIIYVGSSTSRFPMRGHGIYGTSKVAPLFLVEVLAKEIGHRGVTVNSVLPTATEGAGVSTDGLHPAARDFIRTFIPMQRAGTVEDVADACEYLVSDLAGFVSGQHLLLSGGGPA